MPYVEILAPPAPPERKAALAKSITEGLTSAFGIGAETVTLFFLSIGSDDYAHAGLMSAAGAGQRILLKVHAFRRSAAQRRVAAEAMTQGVRDAYGAHGTDVAVYFLDREKDEVAHDSKLASD